MLDNFVSILQNPKTKNNLRVDNSLLIDETNGEQFKFENNIAYLIHKAQSKASDLHKDLKSDFDYHDHYEKDAIEFNYFKDIESKARIHEERRVHETIINHSITNSKYILDVGCGRAWVAEHFLKKNMNVISMDIATTNPKKAVAKFPSEKHLGLVADAFKMAIKDNSIDTIIASEIMEHVPNPKQFVDSLFSCVKPGGKLIITTPYNEKLEFSLCIHCNKPTPKNAHIHSFNEENVINLIPEGVSFTIKSFFNSYLAKLKLHPILGLLPYKTWKIIDIIANKIVNKPSRLLITITK